MVLNKSRNTFTLVLPELNISGKRRQPSEECFLRRFSCVKRKFQNFFISVIFLKFNTDFVVKCLMVI